MAPALALEAGFDRLHDRIAADGVETDAGLIAASDHLDDLEVALLGGLKPIARLFDAAPSDVTKAIDGLMAALRKRVDIRAEQVMRDARPETASLIIETACAQIMEKCGKPVGAVDMIGITPKSVKIGARYLLTVNAARRDINLNGVSSMPLDDAIRWTLANIMHHRKLIEELHWAMAPARLRSLRELYVALRYERVVARFAARRRAA